MNKKKKIILGVLSVLVIGFIVSSLLNPKNTSAQANVSSTSNPKTPKFSDSEVNTNDANSSTNNSASDSYQATIENGTQSITTELASYGYPNLIVQKGVPFKWVMNVSEENLNNCNKEIVIDSLGISQPLQVGENIIEFTPAESGIIPYSCWMGMQNATIAVVDDINNVDENEIESQIQALPPTGGCCGI